MTSNLFDHYQIQVSNYLRLQCWDNVPVMSGRTFTVTFLAGGEYNLNYILESANNKLIFRVNIGTQIARDDQIEYEYNTLKLLQGSGVTPTPYFVDDSRSLIDRGILIMECLDGCPLDYHQDLTAAAQIFSTIHQVAIEERSNHLIIEQKPLSLIYGESAGLLEKYFRSDLAKPAIRAFLEKLLIWAEGEKNKEHYFIADPWLCIVNTEVNSGNFIISKDKNSAYLIDWEMARFGDPSSDLCHFCSPLTTLWKSDYKMSPDAQTTFLKEYTRHVRSRHLRDTLAERIRLKLPFVMLRGISWSAMGWVAYQTDYQGIRNEETRKKLSQYMDLDFIKELFSPFIAT
ncbi:MAG: phosphotransferase family protein [Desulforhopalus sp.]